VCTTWLFLPHYCFTAMLFVPVWQITRWWWWWWWWWWWRWWNKHQLTNTESDDDNRQRNAGTRLTAAWCLQHIHTAKSLTNTQYGRYSIPQVHFCLILEILICKIFMFVIVHLSRVVFSLIYLVVLVEMYLFNLWPLHSNKHLTPCLASSLTRQTLVITVHNFRVAKMFCYTYTMIHLAMNLPKQSVLVSDNQTKDRPWCLDADTVMLALHFHDPWTCKQSQIV